MNAPKLEILKTKFLGVTLILLVLGGIFITVCRPENAKDIWLIFGPIVSGGLIYLAGQQHKQRAK